MFGKQKRMEKRKKYKRGIQETGYIKIIEELLIWLWDITWKIMVNQMREFRVAKENFTELFP